MYRAFSLIELMVVIAIVAILAAVAVPAYKNHLIATRFASALHIGETLSQRAIEYSAKHGHFPNARELGFSTSDAWGQTIAEPEASQLFGPYYLSYAGGYAPNVVYDVAGTNCGQFGSIIFELDGAKLGFSPDVATSTNEGGRVRVACYYWHYNGIVNHMCNYVYGNASTDGTDNIVPGYINEYSPEGYALWSNNYKHVNDSTCQ